MRSELQVSQHKVRRGSICFCTVFAHCVYSNTWGYKTIVIIVIKDLF